MTPITQYRADDGTVFTTEAACLKHESLATRVKLAIAPLGKAPKGVEDGKGWLQHSEATYRGVHRALVKLAAPLFKGFDELDRAARQDPESIHPMGFAGRVISENDSPIWKGWHRLMCTDSQFREHQQPYFAINGPDKAHVCVEDRR